MRLILLALMLLGTTAHAEWVTSSGYGKTFDEALKNAKQISVEQIAGTFIVGESSVEQEIYRSRIVQYNGGLITRYELVSTHEADGLIEVRIHADVDTRKVNSLIIANGANTTSDMPDKLKKSRDEFHKSQAVMTVLDDPAIAYAIEVGEIKYQNRGDLTDVAVQLKIVHSPKWLDDVRTFSKFSGQEIDVADSNWIWFPVTLTAAAINPLYIVPSALVMTLIDHGTSMPQPSFVTCFSNSAKSGMDTCFGIRHPLSKIYSQKTISLSGKLLTSEGDIPLQTITVGGIQNLLKNFRAGEHLYIESAGQNFDFSAPGTLLFESGELTIQYDFVARTNDLEKMRRIEFHIL